MTGKGGGGEVDFKMGFYGMQQLFCTVQVSK